MAGSILKVTRQLCLRLAQYFIRGSCIFTVLAQFAHFSKSRKKRKHCANAISLQKNMPEAKPQLLTYLLDELCQFSDIFQFFVIFQSVIALRKIQKLKKCPKVGRIDPEGGAATVVEACAMFSKRKWHLRSACAFCAICAF